MDGPFSAQLMKSNGEKGFVISAVETPIVMRYLKFGGITWLEDTTIVKVRFIYDSVHFTDGRILSSVAYLAMYCILCMGMLAKNWVQFKLVERVSRS